MEHRFTIGELADAAGVPTTTVRFYERRGLITPDGRSAANYRVYRQAALARLRFIVAAKTAGFALSDIKRLLELQDADSPPCDEVQAMIGARLDRVTDQIAELQRADATLRDWLESCRRTALEGRCAVVQSLRRSATTREE